MSEAMSEELKQEYDEVFDGEEKSMSLIKVDRSKVKLERRDIPLNAIGLSEPVKLGRMDTVMGLTGSVKEMGVTTPIHVMTLETPDDDGVSYQLLHGLRRLYAARRNSLETINAIVWDFDDKVHGRQIALALGLVLNRTQKRSWREVWELYQILELQMDITPGTLEYLLQLEAGDAMKLKDVMLSGYSEVTDDLLVENKPLEQCYTKLKKLRKLEDTLAKDDVMQLKSSIDGAGDVLTGGSTPIRELSDEEVRDLLEMATTIKDDDMSTSMDTFEGLDRTSEIRGVEVQDVNERHPVDPAIKQATLIRDGFKCRCCGTGGRNWLGVLVYHHMIPVSANGPDTVDNGLTLCANCHLNLHLYVAGKLLIDYENLDEFEKEVLIRILKFGNIAIESYKRMNLSRHEIDEMDKASRKHLFPGEGLEVNRQAFSKWQATSEEAG